MEKKEKFVSVIKGSRRLSPSQKKVTRSGLHNQQLPRYNAKTDRTEFTYELAGVSIQSITRKKESFSQISFPGSGRNKNAGAPDVPQEGIFIAIPANATEVKVAVKSKKTKSVSGKYNIKPVAKPTIEIEFIKKGFEYAPNEEVYSKNASYPGKDFEFVGVKEIDGITVAHIVVYPVQYNPAKGQVTVSHSINFQISYELKGRANVNQFKKGFAPLHSDMIVDFENAFIKPSNPEVEMLVDLDRIEGKLEWEKYVSYQLPYSLEPRKLYPFYIGLKSKYHYSQLIIITPQSFVNAVEPYRAAKSHAPYNAITITTEDITSNFPASDLKESIKSFLNYAYSRWVVCPQYVVLASDTDIIPMHTYSRGPGYPSDHYYSDLNGDMCPEIIVSRFPSSDYNTLLSISNFCANYVNTRGADWQHAWLKKVLFVAYESDTYMDCMDDIYNNVHDRFNVTKLYGDSSTETDVKNNLNAGDLIAHYRGHGSQQAWSSANGLDTTDISALTDGSTPPYVFNICCQNGGVDDNSLETVVEAFIRRQKAIASMGASRDSYTAENNDFSHYLWDTIMEGETNAGRIFLKGKTKLVLNSGASTAELDNLVQYNLFGDPTAPVVSSADWILGQWFMDHDGWKGVLKVNEITAFHLWTIAGNQYQHWHWKGVYTGADGRNFPVVGVLGGMDNNDYSAGSKQSHHKMQFHIRFDASNNQRFSGYVFTWEKTAMAGLTWWENHPFGWYAKR